MSEEKEIKELKREIERLRKEIEGLKRKREMSFFGYSVGDLIEDIVESIRGELERAVLIGPRGIVIAKGKRTFEKRELRDFDEKKAVKLLEALANENRLKILKSLSRGGKYLRELQEELPEISAGTLSSHLNILEEAGLVVQEVVRGRYLITIPGRFALKIVSDLVRYMGEFDVEN